MTKRDAVELEPVWSHLKGYKTIFAHNVPDWLEVQDGINVFSDLKCPQNKCIWTTRKVEKQRADLVLHILKYVPADKPRPPGQIYALYLFESPPHTDSVVDKGMNVRYC